MAALLTGSANPPLAATVAERLDTSLTPAHCTRFPDGESAVSVDPGVRNGDIYLLQPLTPPVDAQVMELALLADACRRAGARRCTAVMPYVGYARQDRRTAEGQAVGARVVADLLTAVGVDRVLAVDPHTAALEALFTGPVDAVSAVGLFAERLEGDLADAVVVAPDLGAVKRAERLAGRLGLPAAFVTKTRLSGREVAAGTLVGEVAGRRPLIVDDMISTGGTIEAAAALLRAHECAEPITVAATHGLFVEEADEVLAALGLAAVHVTDTLPQHTGGELPLRVHSVAPLLAAAIDALVHERPLGELAAHG